MLRLLTPTVFVVATLAIYARYTEPIATKPQSWFTPAPWNDSEEVKEYRRNRSEFLSYQESLLEKFRNRELSLSQAVDQLMSFCLRRYPTYLESVNVAEERVADLRTKLALNFVSYPDNIAFLREDAATFKEVCQRMTREFHEQFTYQIVEPVRFLNRPEWATVTE